MSCNHNSIRLLCFEDKLFFDWFVCMWSIFTLDRFGYFGSRLEEGRNVNWDFLLPEQSQLLLSLFHPLYALQQFWLYVTIYSYFNIDQYFHLFGCIAGDLCTWSLVLLMQSFNKERDFETRRPADDKRLFCSWSR
jgi:hypothetical protein